MFSDAPLLGYIEGLGALALLVLAGVLIGGMRRAQRTLNQLRGPLASQLPSARRLHRANGLEDALDSATALNAFSVHVRSDPSVRLQDAVRFEPKTFESVVRDILQVFRAGRVVSIDLILMEESQAVRLVDFCSGMTAMSSGWMFRVTNNVIILTPS